MVQIPHDIKEHQVQCPECHWKASSYFPYALEERYQEHLRQVHVVVHYDPSG